MAPRSAGNCVSSLTLAAVVRTTSGTRSASVSTWRLQPSLPRSVGLGPVCAPPFDGPHRLAVGHDAVEVDAPGLAQAVQQPPVQRGPDARIGPLVEAAPAGTA